MSRPVCAFFSLLLLFTAPGDSIAEPDFAAVSEHYRFKFPRSHGAHPEYATEWWYFTGHLQAASGESFGFELTFFRVGVNPTVSSRSKWAVQSLYLAHFAVTVDRQNEFIYSERTSRDNFGRAGASAESLMVWIGDWRAEMQGESIELKAAADRASLSLKVAPEKPPVLHGENGISRKASGAADASYYSSLTRLRGSGTIAVDGRQYRITSASAWMDHEVTSSSLARGVEGWDWFALQLDTGEELMLYQLRRQDGTISKYSSGTFVAKDGSTTHLKHGDFTIEVLGHWKSKATSITYPARWRLRVPARGIDLEAAPTVADQELQTAASTGVTYWEGRATAAGVVAGRPARADAYIELVGYRAE